MDFNVCKCVCELWTENGADEMKVQNNSDWKISNKTIKIAKAKDQTEDKQMNPSRDINIIDERNFICERNKNEEKNDYYYYFMSDSSFPEYVVIFQHST